jgi:hypothetical protein
MEKLYALLSSENYPFPSAFADDYMTPYRWTFGFGGGPLPVKTPTCPTRKRFCIYNTRCYADRKNIYVYNPCQNRCNRAL